MIDPCMARLAAAAAGLLIAASPQYADAQGGGRGGTGSSFSTSIGRSGGSLSTTPFTTPSPLTASPPSPVTTPSTLPPSAIGTPEPQVPPVAPLTPPTTSTFLGSGGATVTTPGGTTTTVTTPSGLTTTAPGAGVTATFPSGGGGTAAGTTQGTPGGGADTFEGCMGFWDAQTHMNKREWAGACRRVMNRLQNLKSELTGSGAMKSELGTGTAGPSPRHRVARTRAK